MLGTYACAVVICAVAIVLGRGACLLCGCEGDRWLSAPVGLALLLAGCDIFVGLPGHGYTAGAILLVACAAAIAVGVRGSQPWPDWREGLIVGLVALGFATVPFIVNDRVGVLGVSVLNDTHWHLFLAQGLLDPSIRHLDNYGYGYPLGPHAIAAVFSQSLGSSVDRGLTGLLIATPILTGLAALGALRDLASWQRILPAVLAAVPYMAMAWYVQSAFKEPIVSLILLGIVVALNDARRDGWPRLGPVLVPIAILLVGLLYDYSYPGLVWPIAALACWGVLELTLGGGVLRLGAIARRLRTGWTAVGAALAVGIVLIAADIHRIYDFWSASQGTSVGNAGGVTTSTLANLARPLHPYEGLNLWLWGDWRFVGPHSNLTHVLALLALALLVVAVVRAAIQRDLPWLGALFGVALVYLYASQDQSPYVAAKALEVSAPLIALGSARTLVQGIGAAPWEMLRRATKVPWRVVLGVLAAAAAVGYGGFMLRASYMVADDAMVDPSAHTVQLRSLRRYLHDRPTLAIFNDDYFKWELLGVPVSAYGYQSPIPVTTAPNKPWVYGEPIDFDSFTPATLNEFDYAVTVRSNALSQPPPNWHLIATTQSYAVYKRVGPTPDFSILPEAGQSGALLDCAKPTDRRLSRRRGIAAVRHTPILRPVAPLATGGNEWLPVHLPAGRWELSLPFTSTQPVSFSAPGLRVTLPANLDRPGNPWRIGDVTSTGRPFVLHIHMDDPAPIGSGSPLTQYFAPQTIVAVRPGRDRIIPLHDACGRYVDYYQLR